MVKISDSKMKLKSHEDGDPRRIIDIKACLSGSLSTLRRHKCCEKYLDKSGIQKDHNTHSLKLNGPLIFFYFDQTA